ncbi:MAG TPA: tetratricopeptide repeat protein [Burkholderiales bacterium]|nr:tetratricopeptide repeat protein [Burkholderiales bacterium]
MHEATVTSTTAHCEARQACEHALGLFLRGAGDPGPALDRALDADPELVPAHLLRAGLVVASKDRAVLGAIDAILARLAWRAAWLSERERLHLAAAHAWRVGAPRRAAALYSETVRRWPHDLLALRLAQSCHFLLGDAQALHDVAAGAMPHWRADMPGYDCALAMHAFGLEETGQPARAKAEGGRALAIEPRNPVAIHAVAHALASAGETLAGAQWMALRVGDWTNDGAMVAHNWWHVALFHLALGSQDQALDIYDAQIALAVERSATDAADAAALLWRLELHNVDVGQRWHPVANAFALRPMPALWPLVDVHAAMAFAAAGRARELDRLAGALAAGGRVAREVALPLARAFESFAAGDYANSAAMLATHRHHAWRLGGSHVQREIVDLTLEAAAAPPGGRIALRAA